jgi:hypothetical protein
VGEVRGMFGRSWRVGLALLDSRRRAALFGI